MKVFVVILHYSGQELTNQCLVSLQKLKKFSFELKTIVVINNPRENLGSLGEKFSQVTFLSTEKNLGFAEGNNFGIRYALENGADYILLLNNDTFVAPDFLVQLIKVACEKKKGGIFSPKIYFAPGFEFHRDRYQKKDRGKVLWFTGGKLDWANIATPHRGVDEVDHGQFDQLEETEFVSGCALLAKRAVFEKVGLFDPRYFLYYEDADLCLRVKKAGFKLFYVPEAKIWHQVAASSQIGGKLHDYFMVRNQLLFGWRFAPIKARLALLKQSVKYLFFGRPWQRKGVIDFYLRRFGQGSWAQDGKES